MNFNNYYLYKLVKFIVWNLPKETVYRLADFLSWLHYIASKQDREAVMNNLRDIVLNKSEQDIQRMSLEVFKNFGRYLADFFRSGEITKDYIKQHVKLEGFHHLDDALKKGKGVIAVTAHICNWELSAIITSVLGYPLSVVAMVHKDKRVNSLFSGERERKGIQVIPLGRAVRGCIHALNNNRIIALAGDREFGQGGIVVDFLGKKAIIPEGPAFISLKTGAPIIFGVILRENDSNFRFIFEPPIQPLPTGDTTKDVYDLTNKYISIIERYIRNYPQQWLMFRQFWI